MITVEEALSILSESIEDFGVEEVPLNQSLGRVVREDVFTDRDLPPYDRVTMDGIAIAYEAFRNGQRKFCVDGIAAAGSPLKSLKDTTHCYEVMTGSILPENTDTVVRYEDIIIADSIAELLIHEIKAQQNVHFKGLDRKAGKKVIAKGKIISAAEVGLCASLGKSWVKVSKLPKTIIISTGDELVDIDKKPLPHQIRRSNVYRLQTTLSYYGIEADTDHLDDDYDQIISKLKNFLHHYDLIILSGGVSKGKFDFLPKALDELGVEKLFHKIRQRPGKPFWFGKQGDKSVFALPGNPVSSFLCTHRYLKSWLDQCLAIGSRNIPKAILAKDITFKPDLTYFLVVKLGFTDDGKILAEPVQGHGSGDLANLVDADAFIQLPIGKDLFKAGEVYSVFNYR
ncbi:MAG TPA: molybdopterin molybdotransferase MoeA [Cyclobacteriaceae bacterium]